MRAWAPFFAALLATSGCIALNEPTEMTFGEAYPVALDVVRDYGDDAALRGATAWEADGGVWGHDALGDGRAQFWSFEFQNRGQAETWTVKIEAGVDGPRLDGLEGSARRDVHPRDGAAPVEAVGWALDSPAAARAAQANATFARAMAGHEGTHLEYHLTDDLGYFDQFGGRYRGLRLDTAVWVVSAVDVSWYGDCGSGSDGACSARLPKAVAVLDADDGTVLHAGEDEYGLEGLVQWWVSAALPENRTLFEARDEGRLGNALDDDEATLAFPVGVAFADAAARLCHDVPASVSFSVSADGSMRSQSSGQTGTRCVVWRGERLEVGDYEARVEVDLGLLVDYRLDVWVGLGEPPEPFSS